MMDIYQDRAPRERDTCQATALYAQLSLAIAQSDYVNRTICRSHAAGHFLHHFRRLARSTHATSGVFDWLEWIFTGVGM